LAKEVKKKRSLLLLKRLNNKLLPIKFIPDNWDTKERKQSMKIYVDECGE